MYLDRSHSFVLVDLTDLLTVYFHRLFFVLVCLTDVLTGWVFSSWLFRQGLEEISGLNVIKWFNKQTDIFTLHSIPLDIVVVVVLDAWGVELVVTGSGCLAHGASLAAIWSGTWSRRRPWPADRPAHYLLETHSIQKEAISGKGRIIFV